MTVAQNRQVKLAARPVGLPQRTDFAFESAPVPSAGEGEVVVKVHYLSLDPAMRGWMREGRSYVPPVQLGEVMRALGVGQVVESGDPAFQPGDYVVGLTGVQEYAKLPAKDWTKVDPRFAPLPTYLGVLGMTGMTAYFGLLDVGALKDGDTVVVSGAAGAVGQVVGQIAKIKGCKVIGIAGGADKCRYVVDELGFDAAIDYKHENVAARLRELCPKGIDVYFDNVGGDILDAALANLARKARVVICGAISQYNATDSVAGPKNYMSLLVNRARMEGFVVFDFAARYAEAAQAMGGWMHEGKLKGREDVVAGGVEAFPETLNKLFAGENIGKLVLKVAEA
ncbi:NADP-dependent oxidoreductase [Caulobacter sp. 17J65-9]|uniref:NADP-dependent oxidoreductase n=1 Tax=Caulobacter sp. 17J65-9 TaxID=2709382 RepID=UPI0013CD6617|nr:NADP-dependent oxidoreductase [Caulobacter sp. 17J65-9]NEX94030.1 NADP-dependent oxidoreductase [Caulobacter sp. 17J65-9]